MLLGRRVIVSLQYLALGGLATRGRGTEGDYKLVHGSSRNLSSSHSISSLFGVHPLLLVHSSIASREPQHSEGTWL